MQVSTVTAHTLNPQHMAKVVPLRTPQVEPGIDLETLFKKVEFEPHTPGQWDYCKSTNRFNVPTCGRRWGKSIAAGHRMTYKMFVPDSYNWIVGPTYKLGEKEFRVVWKDFEKLGLLKYCKKSYAKKQGDMAITTPWKAVLEVASAEKQDSLLGEGLFHVIMSEAAKHSRSTWEQYIEPALSDMLGSADFPSTPQGFNWYHGLHLLGQDPTMPDYKSWHFPSWTNPVRYPGGIDDPEIQRIRSLVSKHWFDQEYGASFTAIAGSIYDEFDEKIHVGPVEYDPTLPNYLAFDYGYVNPFVALDIQVRPDDSIVVWREYYQSYKSTMEHGQFLRDRPNPPGYHVDAMWGDPRGADEAATLSLMVGFVASHDVRWKLSVEQIKRMLKMGQIIISPTCPNLIRQMGQLHVKPASRHTIQDLQELQGDGNIQHKIDDHAADALRYFVGPHYVSGAGSHLEDVYGHQYAQSESADFYRNGLGDTRVTVEDEISLTRLVG
jgi:hypothetical protein